VEKNLNDDGIKFIYFESGEAFLDLEYTQNYIRSRNYQEISHGLAWKHTTTLIYVLEQQKALAETNALGNPELATKLATTIASLKEHQAFFNKRSLESIRDGLGR
jgi:hypothetical protein